MSLPIRLAVFDCDGTLVDSQYSIIAAVHGAFDAQGLARPDDEAIRSGVGLPLLAAMVRLAPDQSDAVHESLKSGYSDTWQELRRQGALDDPLYPGAVKTLNDLRDNGWLLGVATGKSHRGLVSTLELHGIADMFETLQTSDRALGKPNPDMLLRAMTETGAGVHDTVMIGDTTFDMEMAVNAKTPAIGVAWGYHDVEELIASGASAVAREYGELAPMLDEIREAVQ
jgi:phosphoglycolate phosphatase